MFSRPWFNLSNSQAVPAVMAKSSYNTKPTFLWQALLIVLPIIVLAIVGFFSLRQDKLLAQQEARERAQAIDRRFVGDHPIEHALALVVHLAMGDDADRVEEVRLDAGRRLPYAAPRVSAGIDAGHVATRRDRDGLTSQRVVAEQIREIKRAVLTQRYR